MNKTALRKFAVQARTKLKKGVKQKAYSYGITENGIAPITELKDGLVVNGVVMGKEELKQYNHLKNRITYEGYNQVMETAAYTWFNRIVALRFMEVNGYLPIRMPILSSENPEKIEPDALTHILELSEELDLDRELIFRLQDEGNIENMYQYLLVKQCNKLGETIPNVFEYITDDLALLLPDNLLTETSVVRDIVALIDEDDWKDIEIVGWLYQFYISEQKDLVFANLKKNKKIGKNDIPAATQLFTPRWIVEYMVDNSLGRLWLESHPDDKLQESLDYYLEDAEQTEEVLQQLEELKNPNLNIEEIKFFDPCCGSGHILVYAFELFYKMYLSRGYTEKEIPALILEKNLYGLDIDKRASQLATFAVVMKAREYDHRLFSRKFTVHVHSIEESNEITLEDIHLFARGNERLLQETEMLISTFKEAKLYGSIIQVPAIDVKAIKEQMDYFKHQGEIDIFTSELVEYILPIMEDLLKQYQLLNDQYEAVVTNPPYMGAKGMNADLSKYVKKYYPDEKSDLFAVFIEVTKNFTRNNHYTATINQHSWMFLSSYEKLRKKLLNNNLIVNMVHLGTRTFEEIGGEVVQNTTYVLKKRIIKDYKSTYIRMTEIPNATEKKHSFRNRKLYFNVKQAKFTDIPGQPITYWLSNNIYEIFDNKIKLGEIAKARRGLETGNNNKYLKYWHEVSLKDIELECLDIKNFKKKWLPHNKGGNYRNWYGNFEYIVYFYNDGEQIKKNGVLNGYDMYLKDGITWTALTSYKNSFRYTPKGHTFDSNKGPLIVNNDNDEINYILGFLNSVVAQVFMKVLNPTLSLQNGDIDKLPIIKHKRMQPIVIGMVSANIKLSKNDWDSFETSWDFKKHPFLEYDNIFILNSFITWDEITNENFNQLKTNEEELNRIFIDIYGLQDELTPDVTDKDVTIRRADKARDVKSFLSYLIGIVFGRYTLDKEGLAYAGGEWDSSAYQQYQPDKDNIIPITEEALFEDDILTKIEELIAAIYGEETLEENLLFIAEALDKKDNETSRERIRRYFSKEFYKNHLKIYQKRPIYWMFSSGKRGAFKGLMYLHRYDRYTIARIRTDYVLKQGQILDNLIALEQHVIEDENVSRQQKASAQKKIENYLKDKAEIVQYAEVLDHIAKQQIELDLDDGVKVNYAKFQDIEVVKDKAGKLVKMNLLEKI